MKQGMFTQSRKKARIALAILALCGLTWIGGVNQGFAEENKTDSNEEEREDVYDEGGNNYIGADRTVTVGYNNIVYTEYSSVYGRNNTISSANFFGTKAKGNTALGWYNDVWGNEATAVGSNNEAVGDHSVALGSHNDTFNQGHETNKSVGYRTAIGSYNKAEYAHALAIGSGVRTGEMFDEIAKRNVDTAAANIAGAEYATAIGFLNNAGGKNSIALGSGLFTSETDETKNKYNAATGDYSIALGYTNTVSGDYSSAVGLNNTIEADHSNAFGAGNTISTKPTDSANASDSADPVTSAPYSNAIGDSNTIYAEHSNVYGNSNTIFAPYSNAIGDSNIISAEHSNVFGDSNTISAKYSNAFGDNNSISAEYSNAFGYKNKVTGVNSLALGVQNTADVKKMGTSSLSNTDSHLSGTTVTDSNASSTIAIGYNNKTYGNRSLALGFASQAGTENGEEFNIAIGSNALALSTDSIAIGHGAGTNMTAGIAIGTRAFVVDGAENGVALGKETTVTGKNAVAIGYRSQATEENTVSFGGKAFDGTTITRRLTNLAEGTADTDATTVGQVKKMITAAADNITVTVDGKDASLQDAVTSFHNRIKANTTKIGTGKLTVKDESGTTVSDLTTATNIINTKADKALDNIGDMSKLKSGDTLVSAINNAYATGTGASKAIGDLKQLQTTDQTSVVGAINEVNKNVKSNTTNIGDMNKLVADVQNDGGTTTLVDAINNASSAGYQVRLDVGMLTDLKTINRDNLVQAINEVKGYTDANARDIGIIGNLNTEEKKSLVGAVNEVNDKVGNLEDLNEDIKKSDSMARSSGLPDNLVEAVNIVDKKINISSGSVGDVTELDADIRSNTAVGAANNLNRKVNRLGSRLNKVGAGAAALAALHPMDYDPDDKFSFAAGFGNYGGENSIALGAFYRPNEDVMFNIGGNMGNGENMVNAGVSFALGSGNNHGTTSKAAMAKKLAVQDEEIADLHAKLEEEHAKNIQKTAMIEEQNERIEKLEAMIQQLASK